MLSISENYIQRYGFTFWKLLNIEEYKFKKKSSYTTRYYLVGNWQY